MDHDTFIVDHAARFARRQGSSEDTARLYAAWYVENYPDGDASHATKFWYWLDEVNRPV